MIHEQHNFIQFKNNEKCLKILDKHKINTKKAKLPTKKKI